MQKLIFVRHAKAIDREKAKAQGVSDKDRSLTPKGVREFKKHILAHKKIFRNAELFVTSPYERAIETLDIILETVAVDKAPIKIISKITPEAVPGFLVSWLKKRKEKVLVIVSHEPFLSNFLNSISASGKSPVKIKPVKIKKGALMVVDFNVKNKKFKLISLNNP